MKRILVAALALVSAFSFGQFQDGLSVKKSPRKTETSTFGLGKIELDYSSPLRKGRELFGELVAYNEVWRMGADGASTLSVNSDFYLGKTKVAKGKYAMFIIPSETEGWTFILNSNPNQWGAYQYDDKLNVATQVVEAVELDYSVDNMEITFNEVAPGEGELTLAWGNTQVKMKLSVDAMQQFHQNIDGIIAETPSEHKWAAYAQASDFLLSMNKENSLALDYAIKASKEFEKLSKDDKKNNHYNGGFVHFTHAKALAANGKKDEAMKLVEKVKADSAEGSWYSFERNQSKVKALTEKM